MKTQSSRNHSDPTSLPLIITAHCSTLRRKAKRLNPQELSFILDDFVRELNFKPIHPQLYLISLNEIVHLLNFNSLPSLISLNSHYFFILLRNTIRNLLQQLSKIYKLNQHEISLLRNCILLLQNLVEKIDDVSKILHWITDITFLDAVANCLYKIDQISKADENKLFIKQISRLVHIFSNIQERLPGYLHQTLFVRLLQPTIHCLTSSTYLQLFKDLKPHSKSLTPLQKLFLIKCPYFLINYNGPNIEKPIEQIFNIMLPRYVTILDKHIKTMNDWHHSIMRAMHYLLATLIFAKGCFTLHINNQLIPSLVNHLLRLLNEPILINNIRKIPTNPESLLINEVLLIFNALVFQPDALDYIQRCKPAMIFRQLISKPCETIVWNSYMMLAYTIDENDIKNLHNDLSQLLYTTVNLLHTATESRPQINNNDNIDRNIMQLTKTLRGLVKYEQAKNEILKHNVVPFLIGCSHKLDGLSKQFLLECLWTLSFNKQAAQQMRENLQFIHSLQNIHTSTIGNNQQNTPRYSHSSMIPSEEIVNDGIYKITDGLLWNLAKEFEYRENVQRLSEQSIISNDHKYKYDIVISYCYKDKDMVDKIQKFLTNQGFKISVAVDTPRGQTMETIAETIDNSALILLCLSNSYKHDNHCQAVAEYAFHSKRFILPLIVHKNHKIDGWLTTIITKNTSIDFNISDFKIASSLLIKNINQYFKKKLTDINTQQTIRPSRYVAIDRQQQQISGRVISRSITVADIPMTIDKQEKNTNKPSAVPTISIVNGTDQIYLPEIYTKRDTNNSKYHSLPINIWKKKDLLDFLYDSNLNLLMPLCESMTGQNLIELFQLCQIKPIRLYKQLNERLHNRFKGLILPIGIYTQFLSEIDHLLDSLSETSPSSSSSLESTPDITHSRSKTATPIKTISESATSRNARVIIRAVTRPPLIDN